MVISVNLQNTYKEMGGWLDGSEVFLYIGATITFLQSAGTWSTRSVELLSTFKRNLKPKCLTLPTVNVNSQLSAKLHYTDTGYGHVVQHLQLVVSLSVGGVRSQCPRSGVWALVSDIMRLWKSLATHDAIQKCFDWMKLMPEVLLNKGQVFFKDERGNRPDHKKFWLLGLMCWSALRWVPRGVATGWTGVDESRTLCHWTKCHRKKCHGQNATVLFCVSQMVIRSRILPKTHECTEPICIIADSLVIVVANN